MSADNFFKGLMAGGIAINKQINDNAELQLRQEEGRIRREAADEAKYKFQKQKDFDVSEDKINADELAANKATESATDTVNNTNASVPYELAQKAANMSDDEGMSDTQKSALKSAVDEQTNSITGLDKQAAYLGEAKSLNDAVDTGKATDSASLEQLNQTNKPMFDTQFAGVKIDPVNRFRFAMRHAQNLAANGDYKAANDMHKQATVDAAGAFANAVLTGDRHTAFDLYKSYPNGHHLNSLQFDKDNNIITTDTDGNVHKMSQLQAVVGAVALSGDPEKAATLMASRLTAEEKAAMAQQVQDAKVTYQNATIDMREKGLLSREAALKANNDQKNMALLIHALGGGGNGTGTSKNGAGQDTLFPKDTFKAPDSTPNGGYMQAVREGDAARFVAANPKMPAELIKTIIFSMHPDDGTHIAPTTEMNASGTFDSVVAFGVNKYAIQRNIDPIRSGMDAKALLPMIQQSQPKPYRIAYESLHGQPEKYAAIVQYAKANPTDQLQLQDLKLVESIRNNIQKYGVPEPVANSATTGSTATALPAATQTARDSLSIGQNPAPFKDSALGRVVSAIGNKYDADAKKAHSAQLNTDVRMLLTPLNPDNRNNTMVLTQRNQAALRVKQALKEGRIQPSTFTPAQIDAINSMQ